MRGYVKSSPVFFRLVKRSLALTVCVLLALAALIPAPLQEQASICNVPNPVKSAWFLLWIQELVSYDKTLIYGVIGIALIFLFLPWFGFLPVPERGRCCARERLPLTIFTLAIFLAIVLLTIVALFFRGENWDFVSPF